MNRIGQAIMTARVKAKLTPKALGKLCGLTEAYIVQVESGKKIAPESVVEKIMQQLGERYEQFDAAAAADKEKEIVKAAPVLQKPELKKPTETVALTGQWMDALAGVIRKYPIVKGNQKLGEIEMVIANKKIEGYHPDKIGFVISQESIANFRILEGDLLMLGMDETVVNEKLYAIQFYGKFLVRRLRRDQKGKLTVSPGLSGGAPEQVEESQIKVLGRVLRVQFDLK